MYQRQENLTHNFTATLPTPQSDLAKQTLKDPYIFDFLSLGEKAKEREIESELTKHIPKNLKTSLPSVDEIEKELSQKEKP